MIVFICVFFILLLSSLLNFFLFVYLRSKDHEQLEATLQHNQIAYQEALEALFAFMGSIVQIHPVPPPPFPRTNSDEDTDGFSLS